MTTVDFAPDCLDFQGGGTCPVQYKVEYGGHGYYVRYRWGFVSVTRDIDSETRTRLFEQDLSDDEYHGEWGGAETRVYLALISDAIRRDSFSTLKLPSIREVHLHPYYLEPEQSND